MSIRARCRRIKEERLKDTDREIGSQEVLRSLKGAKTPKQIARGFIFSDEFRNKMPGNEELVRILYQLYLYRDADDAGLTEWVEQLNGGAALESVVDGFANSKEFRKITNEMKK